MMRTIPGQPGKLDPGSRLSQFFLNKVAAIPILPASGIYNLTISHEKKFLWYRVAKVGTRTTLNHFRERNIPLDVEHSTRMRYIPKTYADYFKFAFVRNPWDRLVSCWLDKVVNFKGELFRFTSAEAEKMQVFGNFVDYVARIDVTTCDRHFRLQSALIDLNNVDYLGRQETFAEDFVFICNRLGIECAKIDPRNVSKERKPYQEYYTDEIRAKVAEIYRKDVKVFGYEF